MTRRDGSLLDLVVQRLSEGPVHTLEIARSVLGLEGPAGPSSAAVFALMGRDPRFHVDAGGTWHLRTGPVGPGLHTLPFAVVDVETTGGRAGGGDRITEIAIVEVRGGQIVDEFSTLVNPGRSIPSMIASLTGITDQMVLEAPWFEHIAPEVSRRLNGRVFVAHNAPFDHRFVRAELLEATGEAPLGPTLCTVQLARGLLPRLRRRNLDAVAQHYGVPIHDRHRALGDAVATARILLRFLDEASHHGIHDLETLQRFVKKRARRRPPVRRTSRAGSDSDAGPRPTGGPDSDFDPDDE